MLELKFTAKFKKDYKKAKKQGCDLSKLHSALDILSCLKVPFVIGVGESSCGGLH